MNLLINRFKQLDCSLQAMSSDMFCQKAKRDIFASKSDMLRKRNVMVAFLLPIEKPKEKRYEKEDFY